MSLLNRPVDIHDYSRLVQIVCMEIIEGERTFREALADSARIAEMFDDESLSRKFESVMGLLEKEEKNLVDLESDVADFLKDYYIEHGSQSAEADSKVSGALAASNDRHNVWVRLGATINVDPNLYKIDPAAAIFDALKNGRAHLDGESYKPDGCEDPISEDEREFNLPSLQLKIVE